MLGDVEVRKLLALDFQRPQVDRVGTSDGVPAGTRQGLRVHRGFKAERFAGRSAAWRRHLSAPVQA